MPNAQQLAPILTLFRRGTDYTLRLSDLKDNFLAVEISKLIIDATSLTVITPSDMKVFEFQGRPEGPAISQSTIPQSTPDEDPMQAALELADVEVEPSPNVRRRPKKQAEANATCGRCRGSGKIKAPMDNGFIDVVCPVCHGSGEVIKYGRRG